MALIKIYTLVSTIALFSFVRYICPCNGLLNRKGVNEDETHEPVDQTQMQAFLSRFTNALQRQTVSLQLEKCPFIPLCTFPVDTEAVNTSTRRAVTLGNFNGGCCEQCSCNINTCIPKLTCCPDILPDSFFSYISNNSSSTNIKLQFEEDLFNVRKCVPMLVAKNYTYSLPMRYSPLMIADCPYGTDKNVHMKCKDPYTLKNVDDIYDIAPVTDSDSNITYRNKFCAMCNSVHLNYLIKWELELQCTKSNHRGISAFTVLERVFNTGECIVKFDFVHSMSIQRDIIRGCPYAKIINKCNETGLWKNYDPLIERQCEIYISRVPINYRIGPHDVLFANIFCKLCNGFNDFPLHCETAGGRDILSFTYGFSGLLRSATADNEREFPHSTRHPKCPIGYSYNPLLVSLRSLIYLYVFCLKFN